jgi:hypothetical protein
MLCSFSSLSSLKLRYRGEGTPSLFFAGCAKNGEGARGVRIYAPCLKMGRGEDFLRDFGKAIFLTVWLLQIGGKYGTLPAVLQERTKTLAWPAACTSNTAKRRAFFLEKIRVLRMEYFAPLADSAQPHIPKVGRRRFYGPPHFLFSGHRCLSLTGA